MPSGTLLFDLLDSTGKRLGEPVDLMLHHLVTGRTKIARGTASKRIRVTGLAEAPQGLYRVEVDPPSYLSAGQFVTVREGADPVVMRFAADPRKVKRAGFPAFGALPEDARRILDASDNVLLFEGRSGADLYNALDPIRRAGFMNIVSKCAITAVVTGRSVLSFVGRLRELRGDRFYASVPHELREEVKTSAQAGLFEDAPGLLHHVEGGYQPAGSWKTPDHYGNLQLSFFNKGDDWVADIDIDDAGGLAHVFQVVRNELTGRPTHPYDIHEILLVHQHVNPGYDLIV